MEIDLRDIFELFLFPLIFSFKGFYFWPKYGGGDLLFKFWNFYTSSFWGVLQRSKYLFSGDSLEYYCFKIFFILSTFFSFLQNLMAVFSVWTSWVHFWIYLMTWYWFSPLLKVSPFSYTFSNNCTICFESVYYLISFLYFSYISSNSLFLESSSSTKRAIWLFNSLTWERNSFWKIAHLLESKL